MKHDNKYLYDTNEVPTLQDDVILKRLELLDTHLRKINEVSFRERDMTRRNAVIKAIQFWEAMLESRA